MLQPAYVPSCCSSTTTTRCPATTHVTFAFRRLAEHLFIVSATCLCLHSFRRLAASYTHPAALPVFWKSRRPGTLLRCYFRRSAVFNPQLRRLADSFHNYDASPFSLLTTWCPTALKAINYAPLASCSRPLSFIGVKPHLTRYTPAPCKCLIRCQ